MGTPAGKAAAWSIGAPWKPLCITRRRHFCRVAESTVCVTYTECGPAKSKHCFVALIGWFAERTDPRGDLWTHQEGDCMHRLALRKLTLAAEELELPYSLAGGHHA